MELSPIPYRIPVVNRQTGLLDRNWAQWFEALLLRVGGVGTVDSAADIEALFTPEAAQVQAQLPGIQSLIEDIQTESIFGDPVVVVEQLDESPFEDATVASVDRLEAAIKDLEALTLWSW